MAARNPIQRFGRKQVFEKKWEKNRCRTVCPVEHVTAPGHAAVLLEY